MVKVTEARKERERIARRDNVSIKIDYISIVFEQYTAEEVITKILGLPPDIFLKQPCKIKHKSYQTLYQAGGIKVYGEDKETEENPFGVGSYLVLSGLGCTDIFRILDMRENTFGDFFRWCENRCGKEAFHLTRLDIAIDDKNEIPFFTPEQIKKKCEKEEFISSSNSYRFVESSFQEYDTAKTVYIGAGKSDLSYRFYDKDKETCQKYERSYQEMGSWKRTEIQLRDKKAHAFAMLFKDFPYDLGKLAFDLLSSNLRFVKLDKNQSNKSRWKTCQFWERFLGAVEPLKLHMEPTQSTLLETQNWLKEGGVLSAVKGFLFLEENKALGGLETIDGMIRFTHYSPAFANKLIGHLNMIGRDDLIPFVHDNTKVGKSY